MNAKVAMFEKYPDVVEVDQLREMLGGISRKLAYKLLSEKEIHSVRIGRTYKIPKACFGGCPVLWKNYSFNALQNFKSAVL